MKAKLTLVPLTFFVIGCSATTPYIKKVSYFNEIEREEKEYNKNIFYCNQNELFLSDPCVTFIENPASPEFGYYYIYGTSYGYDLFTYRSKNLRDWEPMGSVFGEFGEDDILYKILAQDTWAPEIVFDYGNNSYYMFFSSTPKGVAHNVGYYPFVAKSNTPYGPFSLIEHDDYTFVCQDGTVIPDEYYSKYLTFNPSKIYDWIHSNNLTTKGTSTNIRLIDFHPFVDPVTNKKYLYFTNNQDSNVGTQVCGVEMETWEKPKYETLTLLTTPRYTTLDKTTVCEYESNNTINEGGWVLEHNNKYYLSFSANSYKDKSYCVLQAIADSPLGPYRKLNSDEGGVLISTDGMTMDNISGPGHHSIFEVGDELFIAYHTHNNAVLGGSDRHVNIDRLSWIPFKNNSGEEFDVLYANGPTTSLQPLPYSYSGYTNLAKEAKISGSGLKEQSSFNYINDGLLSIYRFDNRDFITNYVKEAEFGKDAIIEFSFDDYKNVEAIMIFNSKYKENSFYQVDKIEMFGMYNEEVISNYIDNLQFDWDRASSTDDIDTLRGGYAAIAEFGSVSCNRIVIHITASTTEQNIVSSHEVSVPEIVILGKGGN